MLLTSILLAQTDNIEILFVVFYWILEHSSIFWFAIIDKFQIFYFFVFFQFILIILTSCKKIIFQIYSGEYLLLFLGFFSVSALYKFREKLWLWSSVSSSSSILNLFPIPSKPPSRSLSSLFTPFDFFPQNGTSR